MRNNFKKMDHILFFMVLGISLFGCVMIYSASSVSTILRYDEPTYHFFLKQIIVIGIMYTFVFPFVLYYPTKKYAIWLNFLIPISIIMLLGLFFFADLTNSTRSWYNFPYFSIQPSEFVKSLLIIITAVFYNRASRYKRQSLKHYMSALILGAIIFILVAAQPDLGSALILLGITTMMFLGTPYVAKNIKNVIIFGLALFIVAGLVLFSIKDQIFNDMQMTRFLYKEPCTRIIEDTGYQVCNGFIAINNGGLFGVGFGNSTQKYLYLPESHTDFIFPIIVEEVGFISGIVIILVYFIILWRLIKIARDAHNLRCSMIAYGTFWFIALHLIINLGGILALIPLTGVPLPFLSYGGSSIMNILLMSFVALRVSVENREETYKKELKQIKER